MLSIKINRSSKASHCQSFKWKILINSTFCYCWWSFKASCMAMTEFCVNFQIFYSHRNTLSCRYTGCQAHQVQKVTHFSKINEEKYKTGCLRKFEWKFPGVFQDYQAKIHFPGFPGKLTENQASNLNENFQTFYKEILLKYTRQIYKKNSGKNLPKVQC